MLPSTHEVDFTSVVAQDIEIGHTSSFSHTMTLATGTTLGYVLDYASTASWLEFTNIALTTTGVDMQGFTEADLVPTFGYVRFQSLGIYRRKEGWGASV